VTAEGDPQTQEEIDDLRGESRWPPTVALLVAIAVALLLPDRFSLWPKWIGPALLSLFLDPVTSIVVTTLLSAAAGGIATFLLLRRRFAASLEASVLAGIIFLCNGFVLHRMMIGHVTYHVVALVPLLCHVLLTPLPLERPARSTDRCTAARTKPCCGC